MDARDHDATFQLKISMASEEALWTTITKYPRSFAVCMVQIGGYVALFGIFVFIVRIINYFFLNRELNNLYAVHASNAGLRLDATSGSASDLYSYEKFIEMQSFITLLKSN